MRFAGAVWMTRNPPSPASASASDQAVAERDRLRDLLERLTYTRTEAQRQVLLEQVRGEIQEIRKLAEF
jgi:hypothetical protein